MANISSFITGALIAGLGFLFLGNNLGWWSAAWDQVWRFWPVILILLGLRLLVRGALFVLVALIILAGIFLFIARGAPFSSGPQHIQTYKLSNASFNQTATIVPDGQLTLDLSGRYDITIATDDTPVVRTSLSGPSELINRLKFATTNNDLSLRDTSTPFSFRRINEKVTGTITIPKTLALDLTSSGIATIAIKDHTGAVRIKTSGASKLSFTNSTAENSVIDVSGAGDITLDTCTGQAEWLLSGAGKITAQTCTLDKLTVKSSGAGLIRIEDGSITDVNLTATGAGSIRVPKPTGTVNDDTYGAAKIDYL